MGNTRSLDVSPQLDDALVNEIVTKTGFNRDEVIRWHSEFLVKFFVLFFNL